jgi:hypothetical protein
MLSQTRLKGILASAALMLATTCAAAALPDGPYVLRSADGAWEVLSVDATADGTRPSSRPVKEGDTLTIAAVGAVPAFTVKLRPPAVDSPGSVEARDATLFVVGDTHGEYEILVGMLRAHNVVDARLRWKFGRGHLVVLGDVFDRGPNHLEILWLLYELEAQSAKAGGGVHLLLGNHEIMALTGDLRYLNPHYAGSAQALGRASYAELFAADSLLGQWLRSKPAMLRVNGLLCLHAGVSRALIDSTLTIDDVNATVRATLKRESPQGAVTELVMGSNGPLWYRGYFPGQAGFVPATAADVDLTLETFGASQILVGHTIVPAVTPLYGGKVVAVQVYPKRDAAGRADFECLLITNGVLWRAMLDGKRERLIASQAK